MATERRRGTPAGPSRKNKQVPGSILAARSPKDFINLFLERWWMGLIAAAIAVTLLVVLQPKREIVYRTEASLLFETRRDRVLNVQEVVDTNITQATELNVHLEQIRSATFFEYLLVSFTPQEIEAIQRAYRNPDNPGAPPPSLASIILPNLHVYARKNTTIMGISVRHRDPEMAALIANRYARKYIDFNLDRAMTGTNSAIVFLRNQAEETRREVQEAERALQDYRARYNMAALGENTNIILQKQASLGNAITANELEQVALRNQLEKVETYLAEQKDLQEISFINNFGAIAGLRAEIDRLEAQRTLLSERYLEEHPRMKENAFALETARNRLRADLELAVAELRTRYNLSRDYQRRLRAELEIAERQVLELDRISVEYKFLEQQAEIKRRTHARIVDRLNEANLASQLENINIKIFDRAFIPSTPVGGATQQLAAKCFALGTLLFFGVPIGIGLLDTRVKSTADVENGLERELLGGVKVMKGVPEDRRGRVFLEASEDAICEAFRGLYSELEIRSTVPFPKVMLITSSVPHEGKSLTSSNLAAVFAAHGRRTLLIDCDFRRPSLHRLFSVKNDRGTLTWFAQHDGEVDPTPGGSLGVVSVGENLFLLPAGGAIKNPTEIIERFTASGLLEQLRHAFDLVIIDTPPAAVFPDALLLARSASELIYVCKFNSVRRGLVRKVLAKLDETPAKVVGVVLNNLPRSTVMNYSYDGYGAYNKKYYKSYQEAAS